MGQEEHQRSSNTNSSSGGGSGGGGGGGGRVSKKQKQKKIPQRGLGVAQLEKIRLEELQKKNDAAGTPPALVGSSPLVTLPRYNHNQSPELGPPRPTLRPSFNVFGASSTIASPPPAQQQLIGYGVQTSGSAIGRHSYFPSIMNSCELNYEREGHKLNPGFTFQTHFRNDLNPIAPSSCSVMQRHNQHQHHHHQIHSSKVNVSNTISSGVNLPIEFPSNQSYHGNYRLHPWPEDEKMVGVKRPWPFFVDNPQSPSLRCNFPSVSGLNERSMHENSGRFNVEPGNPILRETSSGFAPHNLDWRASLPEFNLKSSSSKENGALDTVLTLALPTATSPPTTKAKHEFPAIPCQELPRCFDISRHQEYFGAPLYRQGESVQSQGVYSFFPPKTPEIGPLTANSDNPRNEIDECLDLNLKL